MKRRAFVTGVAATVGTGLLIDRSAGIASADTSDGLVPVMKYDAASGRWPGRPATGSVIWMDAVGYAPKPPLVAGDLYLRAAHAAAAATGQRTGELLLASTTAFSSLWETRGGASIDRGAGGARINRPGDALVLANVPVADASRVTFETNVASGDAVASIEFWRGNQELGHATTTGSGTLTLAAPVPAGSVVANLWLEYGHGAASLSSTSLRKA